MRHLPFLLLIVAGWVNQHQQAVIAYLQEENRILLEQLGSKPKRFTDGQRAHLARKAKVLGRARLRGMATFVTPDTLLRWFRRLAASAAFRATGGVGAATRRALEDNPLEMAALIRVFSHSPLRPPLGP